MAVPCLVDVASTADVPQVCLPPSRSKSCSHIWWGTCMHRCFMKSCEWGSGQPDVRAQRTQRASNVGSIKWRKLRQLEEERLHLCTCSTITNTNRSKRAQSTLIKRNRPCLHTHSSTSGQGSGQARPTHEQTDRCDIHFHSARTAPCSCQIYKCKKCSQDIGWRTPAMSQ